MIYGYDDVTGYPHSVTDPLGATFLYGYNNRGDLNQLTFVPVAGTGTEETRVYDDDGRLIQDDISAGEPEVEQSTTLHYDARHKILGATNTLGRRDSLTAAYSGLGYLAHSHQVEHGTDLFGWSLSRFAAYEEFLHDGLGNIAGSSTSDTITYAFNDSTAIHDRGESSAYLDGVGRLLKRAASERTDTLTYDEAGNTVFLSQPALPLASPREDRASYYAADGKLWGADHRTLGSANDPSGSFTIAREEYRYDALGRRVFVRARRWCDTTINPDPCRISVVRRTVWDGSQELDEIQMPGWETTSIDMMENDTIPVELPLGDDADPLLADINPFFGRVAYTHGLGVDRPLDVIRMNYVDAPGGDSLVWSPFTIVPQWDYRGRPVNGLFGDGTHTHCLTQDRCARVVWPDGWYVNRRRLFTPLGWHGTLVEEKQDYSGTMYRRNRYYDPQTGRFTQEDPIGLAGGLNVYGFAAGDPVNYSDPFGLCPPCTPEEFQQFVSGVADRTRPTKGIVESIASALGLKDLVEGVEAFAAGKIGLGAFKIAMALPIGPGEEARVVRVAGRPFTGARAAERAFAHLEEFHGIDPTVASNRLHKLKEAFGFGAKDNMIIGRTGDVYSPTTGERIGSLTDKSLDGFKR